METGHYGEARMRKQFSLSCAASKKQFPINQSLHSTTRKRRIRLTRRPDRKSPSKPKKPVCVTRLVVEDLQVQGQRFVVTVFNSGNLPSYQVRINVYLKPGHIYGEPEAAPVLAATARTTLGILERKAVILPKTSGGIASFNPYFAVAFDPINDPFPTGKIASLGFQERNLLSPTLQPSLPGWVQFRSSQSFGFDDAFQVPVGERTWKLTTISELGTEVPANSAITKVFYPHRTPTAHSELRQRLEIDDPFFVDEIRKGNVTVHAACQLYTYDQSPRDRGALWLRFSNVAPGGESVLGVVEPPLTSPPAWSVTTLDATAGRTLTTITVRLLAHRRTGSNNNAYFGDVRCALKHRQIKLL
jgi:hypothetical protein